MQFQMKIKDLFFIGRKTIFAGDLETQSKVISDTQCILRIDGRFAGKLHIQGEVLSGNLQRDLWTTSPVTLTRDIVRDHDVWLIADPHELEFPKTSEMP